MRGSPPGPRSAAQHPGAFAVVVAVVLGIWVSLDVVLDGPLRRLDHEVSGLVRTIGLNGTGQSPSLRPARFVVNGLTDLGDRTPMLLLAVSVVAVLAWRRRVWRPVVQLAVLLVLLGAAVYVTKHVVGRGMPPFDALSVDRGRSYPSGHSATALVLWGLFARLAVDYRMPPVLARPLGVLRWLAPAVTAIAMVLLDYHWLTDVVAGLSLGVILLRVLHEIDTRALGDWPDAPDRPDAPSRPARSHRGAVDER